MTRVRLNCMRFAFDKRRTVFRPSKFYLQVCNAILPVCEHKVQVLLQLLDLVSRTAIAWPAQSEGTQQTLLLAEKEEVAVHASDGSQQEETCASSLYLLSRENSHQQEPKSINASALQTKTSPVPTGSPFRVRFSDAQHHPPRAGLRDI